MGYVEYFKAALAKGTIGSYISIGVFGLIAVYAFFGVYYGGSRGFSKSVIRLFTVASSAVLSLLTVGFIAKTIMDPKTASKVLEATQKIVAKDNLTTMMITHNMRDAIQYGNRLVMMYDGHIVVDVSGEEKKNLTVEQLLNLFSQASGSDEVDDKLVLG